MSEATPTGALSAEDAAQALAGMRPEEEIEPEVEETTGEDTEVEEEPEGSETEDSEEAEDSEPEAESEIELETLARAIGAEPDDLVVRDDGSVGVKTKIDGQESVVSLSELRKGYQLESSVTRKSMELAESRKAHEAEVQATRAALAQKQQEVEGYLNLAAQMLTAEEQSIDWAKLQEEDPNAYLIARDNVQQRRQYIQQAWQGMQAERQRQEMELAQRKQQLEQQEIQTLAQKIPEWSDPSVMRKGLGELGQGANEYYGFKPEELMALGDHRAVLALRDAIAYRKLQGSKAKTLKKVKSAPRVAKPGGGQQSKSTQAQHLQRLSQSHSMDDAAAALGALRERKR